MKSKLLSLAVVAGMLTVSNFAVAQVNNCPPPLVLNNQGQCVPPNQGGGGGGSAVPEPGTLALLGLGLAGAALVAKRRRK